MEERSRVLIFDPFSGISGNMILGALIDLGLPEEWLEDLVHSLPLAVSVNISSVSRGRLSARLVNVERPENEPTRRLEDVLEIVRSAPLDPAARDLASAAFQRLADVEGTIHGIPPEQVHFHEVGASDAIVDIIGAAAGVARLDVERCYTRRVAIGRGWVTAEHGALPLPAPATLKLLEGIEVVESDIEAELTTPTGAVLLSVLTGGRGGPGSFVPIRSGYGAGSRDSQSHPNCLRMVLAELDARGDMYIIQADIDDMSPEYLPPLREALDAAGAADVWTYPVQMKKGRTGFRIEVLVAAKRREEVSRVLFENSTTLGLRFWPVDRQVLPRAENRIEWRGFPIRVKMSRSAEGHVICKPEYDDVVRAARTLGLPPLRARQEIERLLDPGA
jgi:hypothetical protein